MEVVLPNDKGIDECGCLAGRPRDVIGSSTSGKVRVNGSVNNTKTRLIGDYGIGEERSVGLRYKNGAVVTQPMLSVTVST